MLEVVTEQHRSQQGTTRRNLMKVGFLGLGGLTLADLLRLAHKPPTSTTTARHSEASR